MVPTDRPFWVRYWGVRGSIPAPGPNTARYGGNTSCVEVRCGAQRIVLDAGTGIRGCGDRLCREQPSGPLSVALLLSHLHWDHIEGFPFFKLIHSPRLQLDIYADARYGDATRRALECLMSAPNHPVHFDALPATIAMHPLTCGETLVLQPDDPVEVDCVPLTHPGGALGYRIRYRGHSFVHASDTEIGDPEGDRVLVELARGADVLSLDTSFTDETYEGRTDGLPKRGWGHSTWRQGVDMAARAGVGRFVLFHHWYEHSDDDMDAIERAACEAFPGARAAFEGMELSLG